jgi:hypothetical protein
MDGRITIELRAKHTPESGSGLVDLSHDAYWLKKEIPGLEYKDTNGKMRPIGDSYDVVRVSTEVAATGGTAQETA